MSGFTVSAGHARAWVEFAAQRGAQADIVLERARLPATRLEDPDGRIAFVDYVGLVRGAQALAGDTGLMLRFGAESGSDGLGILGLIMEASSTMGEAFEQMQRYGRLAVEVECDVDGPRFELDATDDGLWAVDQRKEPNVFPELTELAFARLTCGPRRFLAEPHIRSVLVTHPAPDHADLYEEIFQCPVRFGAPRNALQLHPEVANWPVAQSSRYVFNVLIERANGLIDDLDSTRTVRGAVEARLLKCLHQGDFGAERIAGEMGISRQTLFRRLKAEGTTYADLLDSLRQQLALQYLLAGKTSINEIAYLVGFSEPSVLTHAFKRWTGMTPSEFRRANHRSSD